MHPLTTFDIHRLEQTDRLRLTERLRDRQAASSDDAAGRPPDTRQRRVARRAVTAPTLWAPTAWHVAP